MRQKRGVSEENDEAIGRSAGGQSTKLSALTDALGNPLKFHVTAGNRCDLEGADVLLTDLEADALIADRAYDADKRVLFRLREQEIEAVIPPRRHRKEVREYDRELYKARHLVENFFQKLKDYRGLGTRYDKRAAHFLSAVYLFATVCWLK